MLKQSASQTVGPFFYDGLIVKEGNVLVGEQTVGQRIVITGQVLDGDGLPVSDAMVEIWQADAQGIYAHPVDPRHQEADPAFGGFGRSDTSDRDLFRFQTIKPGATVGPDGQGQAPYINVRVFARGMLIHVVTRLYFSDESANQSDPVLNSVSDGRRRTLIAVREDQDGSPRYRFDIRLQGDDETVFFDV